MKTLSLFLFVLLFVNILSAQNLEQMTTKQFSKILDSLGNEGKFVEALPFALKYLEKGELLGKDTSISGALNWLSHIYQEIGNYKAAETVCLRLEVHNGKVFGKESFEYAASQSGLANLYENLEKFEESAPLHLKSAEIFKKIKGPTSFEYGVSLSNLGNTYFKMKRYDQAESLYAEAAIILKKVFGEEHPYYAHVLKNWASTLGESDKTAEAQKIYLQVLEIEKKTIGENHPNYAFSLVSLAKSYKKLKNYPEAEKLLLQAIQINKKTSGEINPYITIYYESLADLYKITKQYDKAETLYQKSVAIQKSIFGEQHPSYWNSLDAFGAFYTIKGDFAKAHLYLEKAITLNCNNDSSWVQDISRIGQSNYVSDLSILSSLLNYSNLKNAEYDQSANRLSLEKSYKLLETALNINEKIRNKFTIETDKYANLSQSGNIVNQAIKIAAILNTDEYKSGSFVFAEQNKSILLADAVKGSRARLLGDLPDSLALEELNLQQESDELQKMKLEDSNPETQEKILGQLNELNSKIATFKKQLETNFPKYYKLKYANITATAEIVQKSLDDKTLFLEYFIADTAVYLFAISKDKVDLISLMTNKIDLTSNIASLRKSLSDYQFIAEQKGEAYQLYTETANWFYTHTLAPALKGKSITNLIIVADGELGHIPFEVFLVEQAPQSQTGYNKLHYLVNDYNISYNYSATLWKENLENPARKNNSNMLALAATYTKIKKDSTATRSNRSPHLRNLRDVLIELPAAQEEVLALEKSFQGDFLTGNAVNERYFKNHASDYGIIHLAMHGMLNERSPILSSLAFTENHDSIDDNFLEAWEIAHLKLNADLVVLSACETGYGKFQQGEGVMSLARSFMYAGVPSLVVSLWQVNDHSTAVIMTEFYKHLADGLPKDEALRQAKLEYLKRADGVAAHPAFWSPFIQLGDSRPITVGANPRVRPAVWAAIGISILLVIAGIIIALRRRKE